MMIHHISLLNCLFHENMLIDGHSDDPGRCHTGSAVWVSTNWAGQTLSVTNCTFANNYPVGGAKNFQLGVYNSGGGPVTLVNVLTAYDPAPLGEDPAPERCEGGIAIYPVTNPNVDFRRLCFARVWEPTSYSGTLFRDADFATYNPGQVIWLDPAADTIFEDWGLSNFHLPANSPLVDWGTNYVDVDSATPGYQFLPQFDLAGKPRIVDGNADGEADVDVGAYEYQGD
jgi:hypothetical protein